MGNILINNIDIEQYGIKVLNDYLKYLYTPPEKENVTSIVWYEGQIDVDLSDGIKFKEERDVKLECYQTDISKNFQPFFNVLSSNPYNLFTFVETGLQLRLRLKKIENNNVLSGFDKQTFNVILIEDNYIGLFEDKHIPCKLVNDFCFIDNINVNEYGFTLSAGSLNDIFVRTIQNRLANAKHPLTIDDNEIELSFCCCDINISTFIINFNSFIFLLSSPGIKSLIINYNNHQYNMQCFYSNIAITNLLLNEKKVFATFTLKVYIK